MVTYRNGTTKCIMCDRECGDVYRNFCSFECLKEGMIYSKTTVVHEKYSDFSESFRLDL